MGNDLYVNNVSLEIPVLHLYLGVRLRAFPASHHKHYGRSARVQDDDAAVGCLEQAAMARACEVALQSGSRPTSGTDNHEVHIALSVLRGNDFLGGPTSAKVAISKGKLMYFTIKASLVRIQSRRLLNPRVWFCLRLLLV